MVKLLTVMPYFDSLNFVGRAFFLYIGTNHL